MESFFSKLRRAQFLWPQRLPNMGQWTYLSIPVAFLAVFFLIPLGGFFLKLTEPALADALKPVYVRVYLTTFEIGAYVTGICVLLGYPVAALLASVGTRARSRLLALVLFPFVTSVLTRTFVWIVLLQTNGVVNRVLLSTGILQQPLDLLYNRFGVVFGMVYVLLPYMIFPMFSAMLSIDRNLLKAAESLGANGPLVFFRVFLPLSMPGVVAGVILVFIIALGFFITPVLMGGSKDVMISVLIEAQVRQFLNWEFAAALAFVLLIVTSALFVAAIRWLGVGRIWKGLE